MAPRYRTTEKAFIAPHTIEAGSIIEVTGEPSLSWEPLNPEAVEAMDRLYNKEYSYTTFDEKGVGKTITYQPHLNKRPGEVEAPEPAIRSTVQLIARPAPDAPGGLSLAESATTRGEPDLVPRGDGTSQLRSAIPTAAAEPPPTVAPGAQSVDGSMTIIAPAAAPKKDGVF